MKKIMHWLYFAFCSLLVVPIAEAVTYANTTVAFNWIDSSTHAKLGPVYGGLYSPLYKFNNTGGCGTAPPTLDDTLSDNIPIGFTFMYGGVNFTQVRVMSNGRLQFNNNTTCGYGSPVTQLPYADAGLDYTMRIYGNDLDPTLQSEVGGYSTVCTDRTVCYVSFATLGSAPYRSFVVTWSNVPEWAAGGSTSGNYNMQIILQENGEFIYQYGANTPGPGNTTAQVGWQVNSGDYDVPAIGYPASNSALKFYIPRPVAEYRMEQVSWNGTAGEVLDTSGNGQHGTAVQAGSGTRPTEVASGNVCRGGRIANNTTTAAISAIDTGIAIPASVGSVGTITFWYNNSSNTPGATRMLFDATTTGNRYFYLTRTSAGALSFRVTDSGNTNRTATTGNVLPATGWSHIAVNWNFNNLAAANSDHVQIWVNGVLTTTSAFTTNNTISTQIGTLYIGDNRSANSPTTSSAGTPATATDATLDEFRIYNYEGGLALIQRDMNQAGACLSHYAISHSGTGQTCQSSPITLSAHDASHGFITMPNNTTMVQLSTSTSQGDWTLLNGYGVLDNGTANDGIATYLFNGEYQAIFGLTHTAAGTVNINVTDGQIVESASEDPDLVISTCFSNFNACHDYTTSHCSAASGKLYTRLAGVNSGYDIVALDGADNVATTFTGRAIVSLIARTATGGTVDAQHCITPNYTQVLDNAVTNFSAGHLALANISVPNVYRDARIKVVCDATNCPPLGMTWCSTDNFAIRPQAFTVTSNLNASTTLAAGLNFSMTAASGYTNYIGTPVLDTAQMRDHNNAAIGALAGAFPAAVSGTSTGSDAFQYHDVGTISLLANAVTDASFTSVDQPNDCTNDSSNTLASGQYGCKVGSAAAGPYGRFYPHHFTYATTLTPACAADGFTYMAQPNLGINLSLSAKSFNETTTTKYTAGYAPLGTFSITGDNGGTAVALTRLSPALPAFAWSNGTYTVSGGAYTFSKLAIPDGAYDSFALLASVSDPDSATITGTNSSNTTKVRYGRLYLSNNYGSELIPLPITLQAQYWSNGGWANNALDSNCTTLPASSVRMDNFSQYLGACETVLTPAGNLALANGVVAGGLRLSAPGTGNTGTVNLTVNTAAAAGNTCLAPAPIAATNANLPWLTSTTSRATFGIYKGANQFIYMREAY
ncbi:MAG: LamG domain-containing protein [Sideroxydans sp.]|nr:LamG domain-containing protein [Sideroxydans sp.]